MEIRSLTGLHVYYYFGHLCDYQLHRTVNEKRPPITSPGLLLLLEQGRWNEDHYVEFLRRSHEVVSLKDPSLSMEERAEATLAAMHQGVPVIHNGVLDGGGRSRELAARLSSQGLALRFRGETDLLFRVDGIPSAWGTYAYLVADVKSSRTSKLPQMMQVAYYDWLLAAVQGISVGQGSIIVFPDGPAKDAIEERFELAPLNPSLELFLEEKLGDVLARPQERLEYHLSRECKRCLWFAHCTERATSTDDLALIPGLRLAQKRALREGGLATVTSLATSADVTLTSLAGHSGESLLRSKKQALARVERRPVERASLNDVMHDWLLESGAVAANPFRANQLEIFLDIKADPMTGTVFSYGVQVGGNKPQLFWVEDSATEDLAFYRFAEGMEKVRSRAGGKFAVFHFGGAEPARLQRLIEKHPKPEAKEAVSMALPHFINLQSIAGRSYYTPEPMDSLDAVVRYFAAGGYEARPRTLVDLRAHLETILELPAIEGALDELRRAAERIGVSSESILDGSDDLAVVWYRMHLESRHSIWLTLVEMYQAERLAMLRAVLQGLRQMAQKEAVHV